jgi:3-hydroxyacyl-[acyl-carrier-protein] dehydratase
VRFVLLDALIQIERGRRATARAVFPSNLELFADHFPGRPLVPGVLLTETMCQTAGWLIVATCEFAGWPLLVRIDRAAFRRPVAPDEPLDIDATLTGSRDDTFEATATVRASGEPAADARLLFKLFRFEDHGADSAALAAWGRATFASLNGPAALTHPNHTLTNE